MPVSIERLRPHLQTFDFTRLFVEGLGWNYYQAEPVAVSVNGREYSLKPVAEKSGFAVYECDSSVDNNIPQYPIRRKIESEIAKRTFEHLIIFTDPGRKAQVWQWVKRETGKPTVCQEIPFVAGQSGDHLLQRIRPLFVSLEEEPSLNIALVASRVRAALDVEKVTKRFYDHFSTELTAFGEFIDGITAQGDRDWYASLMLNRMMFVYFVQKQRFLDGDPDYLRNRLRMVQQESGSERFQPFYRIFLLRLFHEGLGQQEVQRAPDLGALLGRVPFLNGGLFDVHDLERDNPEISIPDAAFERVFNFFDSYRWHLDERPYQEDNEINPDVLGYIFEKYVNQKQMGAYYSKEDITGYISRNTVIPFLFDAARKECPVAFEPNGGVWRLLRDDPDRYIYPAVGHGVAWNARQPEAPEPLHVPLELPDDIAGGIGDVAQRGGWNAQSPEEFALPTETWREVVARRTRYAEVCAKLASGEVQEINDLITLNLDVERFAGDVISQSEGPELLRAFWHAMHDVSVLDPTCGSGAFLFAVLNILEPLYTACLEGMRGFLDDAERSERTRSPRHLEDFRKVLDEAQGHPSERYFILKSIVLNNLYGVDIMEEAVEICKLRLFLKLVAQLETYDQIEPLPDIDFNVRAGNTLVGFTSLDAVRQAMTIMPNGQHRQVFPDEEAALNHMEERAEKVSRQAIRFREQQTMIAGGVTFTEKQALRDSLRNLADELDRLLATEYSAATQKATYNAWRASHRPFHWFVEFHDIMSRGGFDVVIGNPPYVEYNKMRKEYQIRGFVTERCGNLYAFCVEKALGLTVSRGRFCFIVPLSVQTTSRMAPLQEFLLGTARGFWMSSFDVYPCKLFEGAKQRLTILLASPRGTQEEEVVWTTRYIRWQPDERETLFARLIYTGSCRDSGLNVFPKSDHALATSILGKLHEFKTARFTGPNAPEIYVHRIPYNYVKALDFIPYFWNERDGQKKSEDYKPYSLVPPTDNKAAVSIINSNLFFFRWYSLFEGYHCGKHEITSFPFGFSQMADDVRMHLEVLADRLTKDLRGNSTRKTAQYQASGKAVYQEFYPGMSKPIIDEIDRVLAQHYSFTDEELDFIINYDVKYRMGREAL